MEKGDTGVRPHLEGATLGVLLLNKNLPGQTREQELHLAWGAHYRKMKNRLSKALP